MDKKYQIWNIWQNGFHFKSRLYCDPRDGSIYNTVWLKLVLKYWSLCMYAAVYSYTQCVALSFSFSESGQFACSAAACEQLYFTSSLSLPVGRWVPLAASRIPSCLLACHGRHGGPFVHQTIRRDAHTKAPASPPPDRCQHVLPHCQIWRRLCLHMLLTALQAISLWAGICLLAVISNVTSYTLFTPNYYRILRNNKLQWKRKQIHNFINPIYSRAFHFSG